jgi:hypothetical protein
MKRLLSVLLTAAIAATGLATGCAENLADPAAPDEGTTVGGYDTSRVTYDTSGADEPQNVTSATFEPPTPPEVPDIAGVTWLVEPTLDYELGFCRECNVFLGPLIDGYYENGIYTDVRHAVDERTGELTNEVIHCTHGERHGSAWVYDPELELFGYVEWERFEGNSFFSYEVFPIGEFAQRFPEAVGVMTTVTRIDSSMRHICWSEGDEYLPVEAMYGGFAVAVGSEIVTDFIYTNSGEEYRSQNFFATALDRESGDYTFNQRSGVICRNGETIVPFEFWLILLIDDSTAFALISDRHNWGIITWES